MAKGLPRSSCGGKKDSHLKRGMGARRLLRIVNRGRQDRGEVPLDSLEFHRNILDNKERLKRRGGALL